MMREPVSTRAIVLRRVNHGEADRVLTLLSENSGRVTVYAKGVRKPKSKLAGGLELCMLSDVSYIPSHKQDGLATITSTRMVEYYSDIVSDYDALQKTFELLKIVDRASEFEEDYAALFHLSVELLRGLNVMSSNREVAMLWFLVSLASTLGQGLQLSAPLKSTGFREDAHYDFDDEQMGFYEAEKGRIYPSDIKLIKLMTVADSPLKLQNVIQVEDSVARLRHVGEQIRLQFKQL